MRKTEVIAVTRKSPFTGKTNTMLLPITQEQIDLWKSGVLIQDAFPDLYPDEREFIKSGITPQEWNEAFGDE